MTAKKPDALLQVPPQFIPRPHFACRLRVDLANELRQRCRELNCSQGVFLEVALSKVMLGDLVTEKDVFEYSANGRWLHRVVDDFIRQRPGIGRVYDEHLKRVQRLLRRLVMGERIVVIDKHLAKSKE